MRPPDFVIGGYENPYLKRWWIIPRNRWFNIYLHQLLRDDDDRALHDHPWWNCSIILSGGYLEWFSHSWDKSMDCVWRGPGSLVFRRATCAHRLTLGRGTLNKPCWSLFITGLRIREWGFHCQNGWVPWQKFVAPGNAGDIGKGCDQ